MYLKSLEMVGFKSFGAKTKLVSAVRYRLFIVWLNKRGFSRYFLDFFAAPE